jgi:penicillin-binding protein 1A
VVTAWLAIAVPTIVVGRAVLQVRAWARDLPPPPDVGAWLATAPSTSVIVAADGTVLTDLPFDDGGVVGRRRVVALAAIPQVVIDAVLAAEDARFFQHRGVDYTAIARAAWHNWRAGRTVEGASTITQQLARNLSPEIGRVRSAERKVREALVARQLETRWSKAALLEAYLNLIYLGAGAYGVAAGAEAYFGRPLATLTVDEAALLAGLIQAPSRLDPRAIRPRPGPPRRGAGADGAGRDDRRRRADRGPGPAADGVPGGARRCARRGTPITSGALVEESIPLEVARRRVDRSRPRPSRRWPRGSTRRSSRPPRRAPTATAIPEGAAVVWDHRTGYVLAVAGGRAGQLGGFDRLTQACRQPGSVWKPIVYAAALERGAITAGTALRDAPVAEYDEATAEHWKPRSGARLPRRRGRRRRAGVLAQRPGDRRARSGRRAGGDRAGAAARHHHRDQRAAPMALGASCVVPLELARAYAILARDGWDVAVRVIVRVRQRRAGAVRRRRSRRSVARSGAAARSAGRGGGPRAVGPRRRDPRPDRRRAHRVRGARSADRRGHPRHRHRGARARPPRRRQDRHHQPRQRRLVRRHDRARDRGGVDRPRRSGPRPRPRRRRRQGRAAGVAGGGRRRRRDAARRAGARRPAADLERVRIDRETGLLASGAASLESLWFLPGTAPTERAGSITGAGVDFGRTAGEF